jgi:hypothetical protein
VFDQQHAFPQQIDVAVAAIDLLDPFFEVGDAAAADAEHLEETVPEGLRLGIFGRRVGHSREKRKARSLISFQLNGIGFPLLVYYAAIRSI